MINPVDKFWGVVAVKKNESSVIGRITELFVFIFVHFQRCIQSYRPGNSQS